ncbi:ribosomal-protein-alanine N-acetyltransferase [Parvibaculum indicum]|uniref:ribosomal protein S18-alanine N-acetyltransferase n=1 Tax=Parvibaculum indicum TaxID=562969 RepID=UPI001962E4A1|nr:ribosomal-protein-alanine N-acetyltransferase [Parvibaculum indicum]
MADIRPVEAGEIPALAALHSRAFDEAWDAASFARLLAMPGAFALLAHVEDAPSGFVLVRFGGGEAEIITIAVDPDYRRQGLGRALMNRAGAEALARGAEAVFLEVAEDNVAAIALYERLGFAAVGRRPAYYDRPGGKIAAISMKLELSG